MEPTTAKVTVQDLDKTDRVTAEDLDNFLKRKIRVQTHLRQYLHQLHIESALVSDFKRYLEEKKILRELQMDRLKLRKYTMCLLDRVPLQV